MTTEYPYFLESYANLQNHFMEQFDGLDSAQKGQKFAEFVGQLIPYTQFGKGCEEVDQKQVSHDGGIDFETETDDGKMKLLVQSKYTLKDANDFSSIISKFQNYFENHFATAAGPLFAHAGISVDGSPSIRFQIITLHDLTRIRGIYENSKMSSIGFYNTLMKNDQLEVIDGHTILGLLRTAYRRSNLVPSDFILKFATNFITWNNVYIGIVSSKQLQALYEQHGDALFFENLRDFLFSTDVNEEIVKTVIEAPVELLARNNGLVFKTNEIEVVSSDELKLFEASVVNGCQTTISVVKHAQDECFVSVKVVNTSSDTSKTWDITKSANFQNQVKRFDLELAQFLRPQLVKKTAAEVGYRYRSNQNAFSVVNTLYSREVAYEELRSIFIGIFSREPNNIFDTNYTHLLLDLIAKFYTNDKEAGNLFESLFAIQQAADVIAAKIKQRLVSRSDDTYKRFFKPDKTAYRAFLTLLAACAASEIDISSRYFSIEEKYNLTIKFFDRVMNILRNDPARFDKYYRIAVSTVSATIKGRDKSEIKQYLWKHIRETGFEVFLERVHQSADLFDDLELK